MNLATAVILAIVIVCLIMAFKYVRKHGVEDCTGGCDSCGGNCSAHIKKGLAQARKELEEEKRLGNNY